MLKQQFISCNQLINVFGQQKTNCELFDVLKTLIQIIIPWTLFVYQVKEQGSASIREDAPIRINTVLIIRSTRYHY